MGNAYLWIKALHLVFVVSGLACLFCLPRIYVNLAMVEDAVTRERLLPMGRKLLRFRTILAVVAVFWHRAAELRRRPDGRLGAGEAAVGAAAGRIPRLVRGAVLAVRERGKDPVAIWFRWFNGAPVLLLTPIVVLVIVKPF